MFNIRHMNDTSKVIKCASLTLDQLHTFYFRLTCFFLLTRVLLTFYFDLDDQVKVKSEIYKIKDLF